MRKLPFIVTMFFSVSAFAQAQSYSTLNETLAHQAHLNCSAKTQHGVQFHLHLSQDGKHVTAAQIASVQPGFAVYIIDLDREFEPMDSTITRSNKNIVFSASYDNMDYFTAMLTVSLHDSSHGIVGEFSYDDGDGIMFSADNLRCSALNYISIPN